MRLAFFLLFLAATPALAQGTGTLAGQVFEADSVTTVIGANVRIEGTTLGAATDIDGNYRIIGVPPGSYTVAASSVGYDTVRRAGVDIGAGATSSASFYFKEQKQGFEVEVCGHCGYWQPFTNDAIGYSRILTGWDLEQMPVNR